MPPGVLAATFDVYGAQGGSIPNFAVGGTGGHARATLPVTPGEIVNLLVGGVGGSFEEFRCSSDPLVLVPGAPGGFNGGAQGADAQCAGGGGGGATDVRIGGVDVANRVLVAGGGGGAALRDAGGCVANGGLGGGATGGAGQCGQAGAGGNQTGSTGSGTLGFGSRGTGNIDNCNVIGAGGGGGGYWGGAGGRNNDQCTNAAGGGGGGSGFGPAGAVVESGGQQGNGRVVISYTTIPSPTIATLSPDGGPSYGTTTVTITGTNLNTRPPWHHRPLRHPAGDRRAMRQRDAVHRHQPDRPRDGRRGRRGRRAAQRAAPVHVRGDPDPDADLQAAARPAG